ncbi:hypothetical protein LJR066_003317 [Acidovorax sp. LjRoot66]|uniref:hypothetical protein n=1 Tax=Acidovorax sp. LjRoot66 TaxID=3342334 RepID=UPI003ED07397
MRHKLQTSADGDVIEPDVHDAKLIGILLRGKDAVIELETADRKTLRLVLFGVQRLVADNFREGNILLDVAVVTGSKVSIRDVAAAYGVKPENQKFLTEVVDLVASGALTVVTLNPSYGCSLTSLCERVEVEYSD